ncbi:hypothetical protein, partial [Richelia intracellularis]
MVVDLGELYQLKTFYRTGQKLL